MALLDERAVVVQPSLVRALGGMHEAAVTQQLHYHDRPVTRAELADELGLSVPQVKRTLRRLGDVVVEEQGGGYDRTKAYTLDRSRLDEILDSHRTESSDGSDGSVRSCGRDRPILLSTRELEVERKTRALAVVDGGDDRFDQLWDRYPKKLGRKAALKAYRARIRAGDNPDDISTAVDNYVASVEANGTAPKYVMYPATFFGPNERWNDYLAGPIIDKPEASGIEQSVAAIVASKGAP